MSTSIRNGVNRKVRSIDQTIDNLIANMPFNNGDLFDTKPEPVDDVNNNLDQHYNGSSISDIGSSVHSITTRNEEPFDSLQDDLNNQSAMRYPSDASDDGMTTNVLTSLPVLKKDAHKWTFEQTQRLLEMYVDSLYRITSDSERNRKIFQEMAYVLNTKYQSELTGDQCDSKVRNLKGRYREIKQFNQSHPNDVKFWPYTKLFDRLFDQKAAQLPTSEEVPELIENDVKSTGSVTGSKTNESQRHISNLGCITKSSKSSKCSERDSNQSISPVVQQVETGLGLHIRKRNDRSKGIDKFNSNGNQKRFRIDPIFTHLANNSYTPLDSDDTSSSEPQTIETLLQQILIQQQKFHETQLELQQKNHNEWISTFNKVIQVLSDDR